MKDNEVYLGLTGGFIRGTYWYGKGHWPSEGSPASVAFNYQDIYDREREHHDVVGFYHTHPHCIGFPSSTDYRTMAGWTVAFGRPLACLIEGTDGLHGWWFIDDETEPVEGWVRQFNGCFIGKVPKPCLEKIKEKNSVVGQFN